MYSTYQNEDEQTYRLRWDGNASAVDFTEYFSSLRENEELFDVTLGCANENGGSTALKAHKTFLSAYSPIFKDMFLRIPDRYDPFIFLKGLPLENLHHILDFVYYGSVNITRSNIKSFLNDAKDLQIKGLDFGEDVENDAAVFGKQEIEKPKKAKDYKQLKEDIVNEYRSNNSSNDTNLKRKNKKEASDDDYDDFKERKASKGKNKNKGTKNMTREDLSDFFVDEGKFYMSGNNGTQKRPLAKCLVCEKDIRRDHIAKHIVAQHKSSLEEIGSKRDIDLRRVRRQSQLKKDIDTKQEPDLLTTIKTELYAEKEVLSQDDQKLKEETKGYLRKPNSDPISALGMEDHFERTGERKMFGNRELPSVRCKHCPKELRNEKREMIGHLKKSHDISLEETGFGSAKVIPEEARNGYADIDLE